MCSKFLNSDVIPIFRHINPYRFRNEDNFDFIRQQFDNENINAPDTLGEAQLLSKILNDNNEEKIVSVDNRSSRKRGLKAGVAIAAAFAIVVGAAFAYPYLTQKEPQPVDEIGKVEEDSGVDLAHFTSHREINALINRMYANENLGFGIAKDASGIAAMDESYGEGGAGGGGEDYAETYKQVDSVDEADIIKTDGAYIYHYNMGAIQVYAANGGAVMTFPYAN